MGFYLIFQIRVSCMDFLFANWIATLPWQFDTTKYAYIYSYMFLQNMCHLHGCWTIEMSDCRRFYIFDMRDSLIFSIAIFYLNQSRGDFKHLCFWSLKQSLQNLNFYLRNRFFKDFIYEIIVLKSIFRLFIKSERT